MAKKLTSEEYINKAIKVHGKENDYSETKYIDSLSNITYICENGHTVTQRANNHLAGHGCPKCNHRNEKKTTKEFKKDSIEIHGTKYSYDKVNYKDRETKVIITCKIHGDFSQRPKNHLDGKGCPRCQNSRGENKISKVLKSLGVEFQREKTFEGCRNKLPLRFDFWLPKENLIIEYHGIQHYRPIKYFGGAPAFERRLRRDKIKREYAHSRGFNYLEIPYTQRGEIEKILKKRISLKKEENPKA